MQRRRCFQELNPNVVPVPLSSSLQILQENVVDKIAFVVLPGGGTCVVESKERVFVGDPVVVAVVVGRVVVFFVMDLDTSFFGISPTVGHSCANPISVVAFRRGNSSHTSKI